MLQSSLISQDSYDPIIASMNTFLDNMSIWDYLSTIFVSECNRLILVSETSRKKAILDDGGHAAAVTRRPRSKGRHMRRPRGESPMSCF